VKGECFIRRVVPQAGSRRGKTAELWCLVGRVELLPLIGLGEFDAPTGYRHYDALTNRYTDYPAEEILHLKTWNPANPQRGLSPIQAGIDAITAAKSGLESRVKQYQNQGPPVFIFDKKANQPWTKEQSGQVRNWLASFFGNGRRAGEIPITGGDLGSISLGLSVKDMENLDAIPYDKDAVADLFRFPGQLLNGSKGTTFSNMAEAGAALYSRCVLPLETVLRDGLNRWIGPEYDDGQYLDFDISHIPELQPSKEKMATWLATAWWVSVKDKQKMMGLEVKWNGPEYLIPSTLMGSDELTAGVPDDAAAAGEAS
jgi:HK97 family phage portal protein